MRLTHRSLDIPYRRGHFTISAERSDAARTVLLVGRDGDNVGIGEAAPSQRVTGAGGDAVMERLAKAAPGLASLHVGPTEEPPVHPFAGEKGPAACALDGLLLDLWAQAHGKPLWRVLDLPRPEVPTSATLSMGSPEAMADEARHHLREGFQILKVKLGEAPERDLPRLQAVRDAAPRVALRVDGNEGWTLDDVVALLPAFAEAGVELIEQPLSRDASDDAMRRLTALCDEFDVAHVLDERVHGAEDAHAIGRGRLAHGINLKLQKAGGLTNGLAVIDAAKDHGLGVMVGCFIETWAGISLALQLAGHADWIDLDGAWLLAEEPVVPTNGRLLEDGHLHALDQPGLGLQLAPAWRPLFDASTTSL